MGSTDVVIGESPIGDPLDRGSSEGWVYGFRLVGGFMLSKLGGGGKGAERLGFKVTADRVSRANFDTKLAE